MEQQGRSNRKRKQVLLVILAVIIITAISSPTIARYIRSSAKTENRFSPARSVTPEIAESFVQGVSTVKKDVSVKVGDTNYPVYVRTGIIFNWRRSSDELLYFVTPVQKPTADASAGEYDYTFEWNTDDWEYNKADGYYYCKKPIDSGGQTPVLINRCEQLRTFTDSNGEEYTLSVEIIVQTVQAVGHTDDDKLMAAQDAWSLPPDEGNATVVEG